MITRSRLGVLLMEYAQRTGKKPDLIAIHPRNMAQLRKEGPVFNSSRGYNELFDIEIIETYRRAENTVAFFVLSQLNKVQ